MTGINFTNQKNMKTVTITCASDDLIEVEGAIYEEYNHYNSSEEEPSHLMFSDGTLLRILYDEDGIWRITRIATGAAEFSLVQGNATDDTFDVATLTGDLKWCFHATGGTFTKAKA